MSRIKVGQTVRVPINGVMMEGTVAEVVQREDGHDVRVVKAGGGAYGWWVPEEACVAPYKLRVGQPLYVQVGGEPSDEDQLVGVVNDADLAKFIVDCVNLAIEAQMRRSS